MKRFGWICWALVAVWFFAGCATTDGARRVSMGCVDPLSAECDDPSAVGSLIAQLPTKRTFGIPEPMVAESAPAPPPVDTPASNLLKKLGK